MNENVSTPPARAEKIKLPLTHSTLLKLLAFVLAIVMLAGLAGGVLGAALMMEYNVYKTPKDDFLKEMSWGLVHSDGHNLIWYVGRNDYEGAHDYVLANSNIAAADIVCEGKQHWTWTYGEVDAGTGTVYESNWHYSVTDSGAVVPSYEYHDAANVATVRLRIAEMPTEYDEYWLCYWLVEIVRHL